LLVVELLFVNERLPQIQLFVEILYVSVYIGSELTLVAMYNSVSLTQYKVFGVEGALKLNINM
jgi:hypothetical protein